MAWWPVATSARILRFGRSTWLSTALCCHFHGMLSYLYRLLHWTIHYILTVWSSRALVHFNLLLYDRLLGSWTKRRDQERRFWFDFIGSLSDQRATSNDLLLLHVICHVPTPTPVYLVLYLSSFPPPLASCYPSIPGVRLVFPSG
jgi:hypothetical protein